MLSVARMRLAQVADLVRTNGWSAPLREVLFLGRTATVVEKDLAELVERPAPLAKAGLRVLEIDHEMLSSGVFDFEVGYRGLKALNHLKHGYHGYALARGNVIVGDTWHSVTQKPDDVDGLHEDVRQFGFRNWNPAHVYTFDVFVAPSCRKGGISAAFQNSAMLGLRSKGYTKAYGFYWADNFHAQWCTRVTNRWKELRAFRVSRFVTFKKAALVTGRQGESKDEALRLETAAMAEKRN